MHVPTGISYQFNAFHLRDSFDLPIVLQKCPHTLDASTIAAAILSARAALIAHIAEKSGRDPAIISHDLRIIYLQRSGNRRFHLVDGFDRDGTPIRETISAVDADDAGLQLAWIVAQRSGLDPNTDAEAFAARMQGVTVQRALTKPLSHRELYDLHDQSQPTAQNS